MGKADQPLNCAYLVTKVSYMSGKGLLTWHFVVLVPGILLMLPLYGYAT